MTTVLVSQKELLNKIETKTAKVGIIGLGYVGLPTAHYHVMRGYDVTGFDLSLEKVEMIQNGVSYIEDVTEEDLRHALQTGRLHATTDLSQIVDMDIVIICVPTPINEYKEPDLSFVASASQTVAMYAKRGALVILESTTYPGTTEEYVVPPLQEKGYVIGKDVFVAYSPERVDPGNERYSLHNTPKVVGGITEACTEAAAAFIGDTAYPVSNVRVAEMSKVFENSFRWVNIGFVNEIARLCHQMDIDVWETIEASATKPYGFMKFTPGIGVGGHCIPVDPYYLTYKAKEYGERAKMIELAGELNDQMTHYTYYRVIELLNEKGILLKDAKIVVLGASYKEDINDVRESPVLPLIERLVFKTKGTYVVDPYVEEFTYKDVHYKTFPYDPQLIRSADLVILATAHQEFPYEEIAQEAQLILDTKNRFAAMGIEKEHIVKL
jgi:UDP-N-acetyl-D-glucosamine dehydrogenase